MSLYSTCVQLAEHGRSSRRLARKHTALQVCSSFAVVACTMRRQLDGSHLQSPTARIAAAAVPAAVPTPASPAVEKSSRSPYVRGSILGVKQLISHDLVLCGIVVRAAAGTSRCFGALCISAAGGMPRHRLPGATLQQLLAGLFETPVSIRGYGTHGGLPWHVERAVLDAT
jgi:hypothetical protein